MLTTNPNLLNVEENHGHQLTSLFENNLTVDPIIKRGFATIKEIAVNSILFVGLNPSYTLDVEPNEPQKIFYQLSGENNYKYFRRFEEISKLVNSPWSHLDLLTVRETNQKKITELIRNPEGLNFIWEHLQLTKVILEKTSPKLIVVSNTLARTFLGKDIDESGNRKWLDYKFQFDDQIGTDRIISTESNLFQVPVFFTSMLTGQRALDNGSFERLQWHVKKVLNNL